MSKVEWSDGLTIGVPGLDDDHRYLLAMIGELECVEEQSVHPTLAYLLDRLTIYAHLHFQREEVAFAAAGTPLEPGHRSDHDHFKSFIAEMRAELAIESSLDRAHALLDYLLAWVAQHVADHDRRLAAEEFDAASLERIIGEAAPAVRLLFDAR